MHKKVTGSTFLLASALIYGLFGFLSRKISEFSPFSQSWIKSIGTLIVILLIFYFGKLKWKKIEKKDIKWFLIWILPASFQPVMTFLAFNHLPLGTTYFLVYSTMILGGIFSGKIFFSEKLNLSKILSLILLFIGLILIYRSDITFIKNVYVLLALLAGLVLGFWNTLTKKVSGNYSEFQMISLDTGFALIVSLVASIFFGEKLPPFSSLNSWLWILIFSFSAVFATIFLIKGFKYVEAQVGSLILPMEIVFGSFFGYILLGEILKLNMYIGGSLILIAALLPAINFQKKSDIISQ